MYDVALGLRHTKTNTIGLKKQKYTRKGEVTSPTFNIIKEYTSGEMPLYHMDVYRLEGKVEDLGIEEYYTKKGITIIEWADMIRDELPEERLEIKFKVTGEEKRTLTITPYGSKYEDLCEDVI